MKERPLIFLQFLNTSSTSSFVNPTSCSVVCQVSGTSFQSLGIELDKESDDDVKSESDVVVEVELELDTTLLVLLSLLSTLTSPSSCTNL